MNILRLIATVTCLLVVTVLGAPGDRIDDQSLKNPIRLNLGAKGFILLKELPNGQQEATLVPARPGKQPGVSVELKKEPEFIALTLQNRLPKALRYRAAVRLKGSGAYVETSLIVPVTPGLFSFESWQDPIEELVLFDFKLTDEKL